MQRDEIIIEQNGAWERLLAQMKAKLDSEKPLAKGQVWKMRAAHIEIVALGEELIHYRITNQLGPKQVSAQLSGIEAMENYLRTNEARLATGASAN
jgi:hypothetical protein